jgi:hypothetical protein
MHYGWRRRSGSSHTIYWKTLVVPLFAVAVILFGVVWEASYGDADAASRDKLLPAEAKPGVVFASSPGVGLGDTGATDAGDIASFDLDASRHEVAGLRQELVEENLQITQGNTALITANQRVQVLEGELAAATQKQAEAKADRAEALRVAGKMWEDWRSLRKNLTAACAALDVNNNNHAAPVADAAAVAAACRDIKQ